MRMNHSTTLKGVHRWMRGRCEEGCVGSLLGLSGICPEMKNILSPSDLMACEYGPMALGARLLFISSFISSLLFVTGLSCLYL